MAAAAVDEDVLCPVSAVLRTSRVVVSHAEHLSIDDEALDRLCNDVSG
jgi:hypothetical protein